MTICRVLELFCYLLEGRAHEWYPGMCVLPLKQIPSAPFMEKWGSPLNLIYFYLYLFACICVCAHVCQCLQKSKEGARSPRDNCEPANNEGWELNSGPLQEH